MPEFWFDCWGYDCSADALGRPSDQLKVQRKILNLKSHDTLECLVKCAEEAWVGFFILEFLIFFRLHFKLLHRQGVLQKCWQNLIHTVVSWCTKLSCFSILLQEAFLKAVLEMQVYPVTRPWHKKSFFYTAGSGFGFFPFFQSQFPHHLHADLMHWWKLGYWILACMLRHHKSQQTHLSSFWRQRCHVSGLCTSL